jgi:LysM repeat protein
MVSNQVLAARVAAGLMIVSIAASGCAHMHQSAAPAAQPETQAAPPPAAQTAPAPEMTATEAGIAAAGTGARPAASGEVPVVNPGAPKHYVVKKGDTLWGIASMYLRDPWLWPEVWIINPQIPNPHLIYPGDKLLLAYSGDGRPQVSVEEPGVVRLDPRLRSSPLESSIPTIPYASIQGFLSHPTVITREEILRAPYVLAIRDMHEVAGTGLEVYVSKLDAQENARFNIVHVEEPLIDPDDGKLIGYEGVYTATALIERPGHPAKAALIDTARETVRGDRLVSADEETPVNFELRAPASDIHGHIIAVIGGTDLVGQFQVVAINRGKRHGLVPGTMLAIDSAGETVSDVYRDGSATGQGTSIDRAFSPKVTLPDERSGTLLVFKVFDRVSYGLVVGASDIINRGDVVHNP